MSSPDLSDDDESFNLLHDPGPSGVSHEVEIIDINSSGDSTDCYYTSDDDDLPAVDLKCNKVELQHKKSNVIKNLFSNAQKQPELKTKKNERPNKISPPSYVQPKPPPKVSLYANTKISTPVPQKPLAPGFEKMIGGVKVQLPVEPYGCQTVLMFKMITAMTKSQNCLLESPTGSGKTLALLCAALAWQRHERNIVAASQAQQYFSHYPQLDDLDGAVDYIASPPPSHGGTPEKLFAKTVFGDRSIYDKVPQNGADGREFSKRQEPDDVCEDFPSFGQVAIHKKRKLESVGEGSKTSPVLPATPEKMADAPQSETPQKVGVPIIYYGARTHKQLQQVIKEFSRTGYCEEVAMTVLSSRDYSCIREFDKEQWGTKNDMCKSCIKIFKPKDEALPRSNCNFYDNRKALDHKTLPPAFDLEDLVTAGHELGACPYYAARAMAQNSQIVFCPYNYLIDPGIRHSMQIELRGNVVVIDEAHNIEDICRDAATFTITRDNITASITEVLNASDNRFNDVDTYLVHLIRVLRNWDDWFGNQIPLVNNKPLNNGEAVHVWEVEHFIHTLNNHNIGAAHYSDFVQGADVFLQKLRESPDQLKGITNATGVLIESIAAVLQYLFGNNGDHKDDFRPALIKTVHSQFDSTQRRGSQYNKSGKETLSLRFMCMNPALVFGALKLARCVVLASGTLTPLISLYSELDTQFPQQVSPNHVIPADRVWIGSLLTCPNGRPLECTSRGTDQTDTQDAIGETVLWVSTVTPHGVLCFLPSYSLMNKLHKRWEETGLWDKLNECKHVFTESRNVRDHNDIMEDYYKYVVTSRGALLFAVYRGKVSEGMDFKDQQARAVITVGVPYPNTFDMAVKEKMKYNDKYAKKRNLLSSREWLRVQAYRALNQAVGRCVRHRNDWGAVLLVDGRFAQPYYTEHLSKWVRNFLGSNQFSYQQLVTSDNSLESFMQNMTIRETEEAYSHK